MVAGLMADGDAIEMKLLRMVSLQKGERLLLSVAEVLRIAFERDGVERSMGENKVGLYDSLSPIFTRR